MDSVRNGELQDQTYRIQTEFCTQLTSNPYTVLLKIQLPNQLHSTNSNLDIFLEDLNLWSRIEHPTNPITLFNIEHPDLNLNPLRIRV